MDCYINEEKNRERKKQLKDQLSELEKKIIANVKLKHNGDGSVIDIDCITHQDLLNQLNELNKKTYFISLLSVGNIPHVIEVTSTSIKNAVHDAMKIAFNEEANAGRINEWCINEGQAVLEDLFTVTSVRNDDGKEVWKK